MIMLLALDLDGTTLDSKQKERPRAQANTSYDNAHF